MTTTKVFQNGNSQALRIPQNMRTEIKDYYIGKIGEIYIAYPADDPWACQRPRSYSRRESHRSAWFMFHARCGRHGSTHKDTARHPERIAHGTV